MRTLVIGVDSGTQSTKVLVVNARDGAVVGEAAARLRLDSRPASRRQGTASPHLARRRRQGHPGRPQKRQAPPPAKSPPSASAASSTASCRWTRRARSSARPNFGATLRPPRNATRSRKNWAASRRAIEETGNAILPGFTASKILWLKRKEPENFARLATVLLPHDYLNFWLTGNKVMEYGDASGTALLDVKKRQWSRARPPGHRPGIGAGLAALDRQRPAGRPFAGGDRARTGPEPQRSWSAPAAATT